MSWTWDCSSLKLFGRWDQLSALTNIHAGVLFLILGITAKLGHSFIYTYHSQTGTFSISPLTRPHVDWKKPNVSVRVFPAEMSSVSAVRGAESNETASPSLTTWLIQEALGTLCWPFLSRPLSDRATQHACCTMCENRKNLLWKIIWSKRIWSQKVNKNTFLSISLRIMQGVWCRFWF